MTSLETLKEQIAAELDVNEFLDIIGYTMYDLVEALSSEVSEFKESLTEAVR